MNKIQQYYEKFDEDHRLKTRHGQVEFFVTMKYIHDFIPAGRTLKILDLGAGTGAYSVPLAQEGHILTSVELSPRNVKVLESKHQKNVNIWPGDARDLHFLDDETFDITLIFGPLYHLASVEDRLKVFAEARRVTKKGGVIFAAYTGYAYSMIQYAFKKNQVKNLIEAGKLTQDFQLKPTEEDLYSYLTIDEINALNQKSGLERIKIIAPDGPADYMRTELNAMDGETFDCFKKWQLANAERTDLLGASSHLVDILKN